MLFNTAQEPLLPNLLENFQAEEKEDYVVDDKETSTAIIPLIHSYSHHDKIHDDLLIKFKSDFKPVMHEKDSFSIECLTRGKNNYIKV